MFKTKFAQLLNDYMRNIRANANNVADEIDVNNVTVRNWLNGSMPKNRDKIMAAARFFKLTEEETNDFLKAAGFSKEHVLSGDLAEAMFVDYIPNIFKRLLHTSPPVMLLLTQTTHWDEPSFQNAILAQAKQIYSPDNVLHIQPPVSVTVYSDDYFADLGKQCGIESIKNEYQFEKFLTNRVENTERLFLLVSRFEQGASSLGDQLASMIRNIIERYSDHLHVMLWGGKKLAALKYQNGNLSLLNIAKVEQWPELGRVEVDALWKYRVKGSEKLGEDLVDKLLEMSGGHPQLLNKCLAFVQRELKQEPFKLLNLAVLSNKLSDHLRQADEIVQLFTPFTTREQQQNRQRVCDLLEEQDKLLANWQPYILEDVLRELYWKNLLVWRENNGKKGLYWRCEAMRKVGLEILECHLNDKD